MSNPEVRDFNNPQQRLVVRSKIDGVWSQKYYGEVGATWTVDATTLFRPGIAASLPYLWTIEVTGNDQITVKEGSLDHNGQTYTWPDTTFTADGSGNYQADNLVNVNGNEVGGTVIVYNGLDPHPMFAQVFMPHLHGVAPDGHNPENTFELGLSEGPATEEGAATGSGSGDPFITPIF